MVVRPILIGNKLKTHIVKPLVIQRCLQTSSRWLSKQSPSFSSCGDVAQLDTKLGMSKVANVLLRGSPHPKLPDSYNLDIEAWTQGAIEAAAVVTRSAAQQDWDSLHGLVDDKCIQSLRSIIVEMDTEEKQLVSLEPENVFYSFVSNINSDSDSGRNLNLVTYSLPRLSEVKSRYEQCKKMKIETQQKVNEIKLRGAGSQEEANQMLKAVFLEHKDKIDAIHPGKLLKENEIVIGNYRFKKQGSSEDWVLKEVSQINSVKGWPAIFRFRWKARLEVSMVIGKPFATVLRTDYLLDVSVLMMALLVTNLVAALSDVDELF